MWNALFFPPSLYLLFFFSTLVNKVRMTCLGLHSVAFLFLFHFVSFRNPGLYSWTIMSFWERQNKICVFLLQKPHTVCRASTSLAVEYKHSRGVGGRDYRSIQSPRESSVPFDLVMMSRVTLPAALIAVGPKGDCLT